MRTVPHYALAFALLATSSGSGQVRELVGSTFEAQVVSIIDGDTIDVVTDAKRAIRIRIEGIDAPERGEPFNDAARRFARVMLFDKPAKIHGRDVDRYGRLVARVTVEDSDTSVEIVKAGLACHYLQYSSDPALARAQEQARTEGRGFWVPNAAKPRCTQVSSNAASVAKSGSSEIVFHGNASSRVYHTPTCRNYNCQRCTRIFRSEAEAQSAGFRPAGDCLHR